MSDLGIKPDVMLGHSTGEFAALFASGVVRLSGRAEMMGKNRLLNGIYQDLEAKDNIPKGSLMTVGGIDFRFLEELIESSQGSLYLAMDNCPNQVVLFGSDSDIEVATSKLKSAGAICLPLPFDRAYHTPLFENVGKAFRGYYDALDVGKSQTILYSCATGEAFPEEPEAIRSLAAKQWSSRVHFRQTIEKLYNEGVRTFIEVGPSSNLTAFVDDTLRNRDFLALASNSQRQSGLTEIQNLLARLFFNGIETNMLPLYQHRKVAELSLEESVIFEETSIPILDSTMPVMRLSSDFVEEIRQKLRPQESKQNSETIVDQAKEEWEIEKGKEETSLILKSSQSPSPQSPVPSPHYPSPNSRLELLTAHFDLMQEFMINQERVTTMVYSNLGNESNINLSPSPLTQEEAFPLLGQILERDDRHLYCQRRFDLEHDIFLYDHTIGGKLSQQHPELIPLPVIPFTISMEILAEAAIALLGQDKVVVGLDNLRGYRWLALDQGEIVLSILAQVQPQPDSQTWNVQVKLFQAGSTPLTKEGTLNATPVFEGYVRLANQFPSSPTPIPVNWNHPQPSAYPDTDLYRTGMFHGPRFQGVKHIRQWDKQGIEADLQVIEINDFFQYIQRPVFQLDAGLLDAAGQLVGYWVLEQIGTDFNVFPFQVKSFQQYQPPLTANSPVLCRGLMGFTSDTQTEAIFDFIDETGSVIARLEGWQDRFFPVPHKYYQCRLHPQSSYLSDSWIQAETGIIVRRIEPFPEAFLDEGWGIWKRVLAHLMLNDREREFWYQLPEKGQRRTDWLLGRIAAKDALRQWAKQTFNLELAPVDIEILSTQLGKPVARFPQLEMIENIPDISLSHSRGYIVAALAQPNMSIGIDLEKINYIRNDDWFSYAFTKQELDLLPQPNSLAAVIGLWCAKEAASKALGTGLQGNPNNWDITHYSTDGRQITVTHGDKFFQVKLWYQNDEILAICQT
ncbi:MAG: polyketide synthase dehydratase domain-containing protein [Potamolinea sp.]